MRKKSNVSEEIRQSLDKINNELTDNCQEQLKILEPEYKKLNRNGPLTEAEFSIFMRYHYYKSQEERLKNSDRYFEQQFDKDHQNKNKMAEDELKRFAEEYINFQKKANERIINLGIVPGMSTERMMQILEDIEYQDILRKEKLILRAKQELGLSSDLPVNASSELNNDQIKKTDNEKPPQIIQELIGALQLDPEPIAGKYKPLQKNDRRFIFWVVNNLYDDRLTPDNYSNFIQCNINENTIKRYYNNARDEKNN